MYLSRASFSRARGFELIRCTCYLIHSPSLNTRRYPNGKLQSIVSGNMPRFSSLLCERENEGERERCTYVLNRQSEFANELSCVNRKLYVHYTLIHCQRAGIETNVTSMNNQLLMQDPRQNVSRINYCVPILSRVNMEIILLGCVYIASKIETQSLRYCINFARILILCRSKKVPIYQETLEHFTFKLGRIESSLDAR